MTERASSENDSPASHVEDGLEILGPGTKESKLPRAWWEILLWKIFSYGWGQLLFAATIAFGVPGIHFALNDSLQSSPFADATELHSFLFGIASILTLIASITFGFLIYAAQMVEGEKQVLYQRLRSSIQEARSVLDPLMANGTLSNEVSGKLHRFELIMPSDLPLEGAHWKEITEELFDELELNSPNLRNPEREDIMKRLVVALFLAEQSLLGFEINDVRQAVITLILARPVYKSFASLGAFLLLAMLSAAFYTAIIAELYFLITLFLTALSICFIVETVLLAKREMDERLYRD